MNEVEVKILEINRKEVESKLKKLGAKKVYDGEIFAYYFDTSFDSLKKKNLILRLRQKDNCNELTLKQKVESNDMKINKEYEVLVNDFKIAKQIVEILGYKVINIFHKHRTSYKLNDARFEIDTPKDMKIPCFLEIESDNKKTVEKYIKLLGFRMNDALNYTYEDVVNYYKKNKKS